MCLLVLAQALLYGVVLMAGPPPQSHDARRARIEQSLSPIGLAAGNAAARRLADRMSHYQVPAVSVAVVDGGALVWAQAWGMPARMWRAARLCQADGASIPRWRPPGCGRRRPIWRR